MDGRRILLSKEQRLICRLHLVSSHATFTCYLMCMSNQASKELSRWAVIVYKCIKAYLTVGIIITCSNRTIHDPGWLFVHVWQQCLVHMLVEELVTHRKPGLLLNWIMCWSHFPFLTPTLLSFLQFCFQNPPKCNLLYLNCIVCLLCLWILGSASTIEIGCSLQVIDRHLNHPGWLFTWSFTQFEIISIFWGFI